MRTTPSFFSQQFYH